MTRDEQIAAVADEMERRLTIADPPMRIEVETWAAMLRRILASPPASTGERGGDAAHRPDLLVYASEVLRDIEDTMAQAWAKSRNGAEYARNAAAKALATIAREQRPPPAPVAGAVSGQGGETGNADFAGVSVPGVAGASTPTPTNCDGKGSR